MHEYEFQVNNCGVTGVMPSGDTLTFATEDEYYEAYQDEESEIYDEMAEAFHYDDVIDYPEDW